MDAETHELTRRRFTVHDYHRMGEAGILHEDDRVELIEGEIVEMAAIGTRHFACVNQLTRLLVRGVGDGAIVSVQNPVRLDEHSEPQPDLTVLRVTDYRESLPGPEDVLLLIEVSDTTLSYDRNVKLPLYARAGIPEIWIVDLTGEVIECHIGPSGDIYRHVERARRGEEIRSSQRVAMMLRRVSCKHECIFSRPQREDRRVSEEGRTQGRDRPPFRGRSRDGQALLQATR